MSKLFTSITAALIAEIILYAVNFTISYFTYGFGDLSRQIQSVYDFNGSNLKISVLEYFVLFMAAKFAVYCVFAGLIYFVTTVSNTAVKVYGILVITIAAESVMYYNFKRKLFMSSEICKYTCICQYKGLVCKLFKFKFIGEACELYCGFYYHDCRAADCAGNFGDYIFQTESIKKPHKEIQPWKN